MTVRLWMVLVGLLWGLTACQPTPTLTLTEPPPPTVYRIAAPADHAPLMRQLAGRYFDEPDAPTIEVVAANAPQALALLGGGLVDLAMLADLPADTTGFDAIPVARDGIAVVVHPANAVENLTLLQLRRMFTGHVNNWESFDQRDLTIEPITREPESARRQVFQRLVMTDERLTANARLVSDNVALLDWVSKMPAAIGFMGVTAVDDRAKLVSIEEVFPNGEQLSTGAYPLTHLLYVLHPLNLPPELRNFAVWLQHSDAQDAFAAAGLGRIN